MFAIARQRGPGFDVEPGIQGELSALRIKIQGQSGRPQAERGLGVVMAGHTGAVGMVPQHPIDPRPERLGNLGRGQRRGAGGQGEEQTEQG